jgi:hypothetical protein
MSRLNVIARREVAIRGARRIERIDHPLVGEINVRTVTIAGVMVAINRCFTVYQLTNRVLQSTLPG